MESEAAKLAEPCSSPDSGVQTEIVKRNICALLDARRRAEEESSLLERSADWVTAFSGSIFFVFLHVVWFAVWIAMNHGLFGWKPFDPFPYTFLTTIVSLEAIFLSTFVLVSQNRQAKINDRHAELNLQVDLLAEREDTRILLIVTAIAQHLKINLDHIEDLDELTRDVAPEELLSELERQEGVGYRRQETKP